MPICGRPNALGLHGICCQGEELGRKQVVSQVLLVELTWQHTAVSGWFVIAWNDCIQGITQDPFLMFIFRQTIIFVFTFYRHIVPFPVYSRVDLLSLYQLDHADAF